jgi:hypothetical protein
MVDASRVEGGGVGRARIGVYSNPGAPKIAFQFVAGTWPVRHRANP